MKNVLFAKENLDSRKSLTPSKHVKNVAVHMFQFTYTKNVKMTN